MQSGQWDECYEDSDGWKSAAGKTITNLVLTSIGGTYTASTDCDGNHAIWGNYSHGNVVQGKHVYENIAADLVVLDYGTYKRIQPAATAQETLPITSETSLYDVRTHFISDLIGRMNVFKQVATKRKMKLKAAIDTLDNHKPWTLRREIVKSSKIMMNRIDLPPVYDTIKSKMKANIAYVETEYVQGENTNCGDEEDGIPDCCSYDFSQDTDTSVIVGLDETVGAWSVLCNGSTIVSKQTRKSLTNALNGVATYDMECWSASTSKFEGALVKQTGNEFVCGSYKVLVGSQTIGDGDRTCDDIYGNGDNTAFASCVSGVNHLKDDLNIPCASSTCTVSDCCDANPTCDDIDGSGADFASSSCVAGTNHLKDVLTNTCANSTTCTANDCCDANPTCGNTDGTGTTFASCVAWSNHLKDDLTYTCADGTCDADDCCDDNPTCDDFNCTGYGPPLNYEDTYTCYGHTCTDTECCNAPTCDGSAITEANAARTGGSATGGTGAPSATEAVATTIIFTCDHSAGFGDAAATTRYTCSALGTFAEDSDVTCPAAAPTCDGSAITEANAAVTGGTGAVAATQPVGSTIIFTCSHIYGFGDAALTTKYTCGALGTFDEDSDVTCPTAAPTCDGSGVTHANAARTGGDANADNGAPSATEAGGTTIIFTCSHIYGFGDAALTTKYTCGALGTFDEDSDVTCPTAAPTCDGSGVTHANAVRTGGSATGGTGAPSATEAGGTTIIFTCAHIYGFGDAALTTKYTCGALGTFDEDSDVTCPTAAPATCSSTSHSCSSGELKSGTITCSSSTCTDSECCDATCSSTSHSCSSGELKSGTITCSSSTCTDTECCDATCSSTSHSCSSGELKSGTITCSSLTCTDSECCDATCSSTSHICSSGELKSGTITCSSSTCTDTECCDATCSSTSHSCSSGELKSSPDSITCSSPTCTDSECCDAPPRSEVPDDSGGNVVCIHPDVTVRVLVGVEAKAVAVGRLDVGDLVVGEGRTSTVRRDRALPSQRRCLCRAVRPVRRGFRSLSWCLRPTPSAARPGLPTPGPFANPTGSESRRPSTSTWNSSRTSTDHLLSGSVVLESWDGYARATDAISDACDKQGCPWPHKWVPSGDHRWTRVDLRQILFDSSPRLRIVRVSSNNPTSQVIIQ